MSTLSFYFLLSPDASLDAQSMDSQLSCEACLCRADLELSACHTPSHVAQHAVTIVSHFP